MAARKRQRRLVDPDIRALIEDWARRGWGGSQIWRRLDANPDQKKRVPALRTVQVIAREAASGEWWSAGDADPDEAQLVLPVLGDALRRTAGEARVTKEHAEWIARVVKWAPTMPPAMAYALGWAYARASKNREPTDSLDRYLALELWRDLSDSLQKFRDGWVDVLVWLPGLEPGPIALAAERPDATVLWAFGQPTDTGITALRNGRRTGAGRSEADVVDRARFDSEEDQS